VEPRGLEPLTPCLQSEGMAIAQCRWGALSVAEPGLTALSSGDIAVLCCCICPLWVRTHHLLPGLVAEGVAAAILERLGLTAEAIRDSGRHLFGPPLPATNQVPPMSAEAKCVLDAAGHIARTNARDGNKGEPVGTEHLLGFLHLIRGREPGGSSTTWTLPSRRSSVNSTAISPRTRVAGAATAASSEAIRPARSAVAATVINTALIRQKFDDQESECRAEGGTGEGSRPGSISLSFPMLRGLGGQRSASLVRAGQSRRSAPSTRLPTRARSPGGDTPVARLTGMGGGTEVRWGVNSPIYQSKVLGEFPDICDDSLILPRWIEAAQKRTLKRNRRPVMPWDIARFGEDETAGMRREGGWIRLYRTHQKADTMTTTGHIVKAHRDINDEKGLNDFPTIIVDVVGVGAGVFDRLVKLGLTVVAYNGGEAPYDKERFINARAEDYWIFASCSRTARSTSTSSTTWSPLSLVR
jgi:hypothetical protein